MTPLIAVISATPLAMQPATTALTEVLPDGRIWHLLDDRLLVDANERKTVDTPLQDRMRRLIDHALQGKADAVLLTCSLYGFLTREYASSEIAVLPPDDAAFAFLARLSAPRIVVVGSLTTAVEDSAKRLQAALKDSGTRRTILQATVHNAGQLAALGTVDQLADSIVATLQSGPQFDAVLLAQYSLSPATKLITQALGKPVISGPSSAAQQIRTSLREAS